MTNDELGTKWGQVLKTADEAEDRAQWMESARALRKQYRGLHQLSHFNKLYMTERNIEATLASERLEATVKPGRPELAARARAAQSVLNWNAVEADVAWERNRALVRARVDGIAFLQTQWMTPFLPQVVEDRAVLESQRKGRSEDAMREAFAEVFPGDNVGREMATVELRDGMDVILPIGCRNWKRLPWTAVRTWLTRADAERLQSSGFWMSGDIEYTPGFLMSSQKAWEDDQVRQALQSAGMLEDAPTGARQPESRKRGKVDPHEVIEVFEIVWRSRGKILHWIPGHGIVREKPFTLPVERSLLTPLLFSDDTLSLWPLPDARQYLGLQQMVDGLYNAILETAKRAKSFVVASADADWEGDLTAMARALPHTFIKGDPQLFREMTLGQITPAHLDALSMALSAMTEMGGATGAMSGMASSPAVSATEQNLIHGGFTGRMKHAARFVTRTDRQVLQRFLDLNQALLPPQTLVPLLGQEALEWEAWQRELNEASVVGKVGSQFLRLGKEAIAGEMSVTIATGAASDVQNALEKREIQNVWNLTAQALVAGWHQTNPAIRALLEQVFERHGINARHILGQGQQSQALGMPGAMVPPGRGQNGGVALSGSNQNRVRGQQMEGPAADMFGGQ